jgi:hypothetical protein
VPAVASRGWPRSLLMLVTGIPALGCCAHLVGPADWWPWPAQSDARVCLSVAAPVWTCSAGGARPGAWRGGGTRAGRVVYPGGSASALMAGCGPAAPANRWAVVMAAARASCQSGWSGVVWPRRCS